MRIRVRFAGMCCALSLSLSATAFELTHSAGVVNLPAEASTIATYDLAVLDTLSALGVPVVGVPRSSYRDHLAHFNNATVVGTLFEPDYTVLADLKPDLIVAGRRSQPAMPKLDEIAPTAIFTPDPSAWVDSFRRDNLALAHAFGKEKQAKVHMDAIDANVEALREINKGKTGAFLFVVKDTIVPHVPGDAFGYSFELSGLESVLPATDPAAPVVPRPEPGSSEAKAAAARRAKAVIAIAEAEPDWLMVLDRSAINNGEKTAAQTLANHPHLSQTQAFKEGRVFYADPNGWYIIGGGLTNLKTITDAMLTDMK